MLLRERSFEGGPVAQLVVDRQGNLLLASDKARQMFGLPVADLGCPLRDSRCRSGRPLLTLDIVIPVARLRQPLRACLDGSAREVVTLEGVNRRGKPIVCKVTCSSLANRSGEASDLLLLMEDVAAV